MINRYQMLGMLGDKLAVMTMDTKADEDAVKTKARDYNFIPHTCVIEEELPDVFEGTVKWRYL